MKNTASDGNGRIRVIDLTMIKRLRDTEDVLSDITLYTESLTRFGNPLSPVSPEQIDDHFLHTYEKSLSDIFPKQRQLEVKMDISAMRGRLDFLIGPSIT